MNMHGEYTSRIDVMIFQNYLFSKDTHTSRMNFSCGMLYQSGTRQAIRRTEIDGIDFFRSVRVLLLLFYDISVERVL